MGEAVLVYLLSLRNPHELPLVPNVTPCISGDPHVLVIARFLVALVASLSAGPRKTTHAYRRGRSTFVERSNSVSLSRGCELFKQD